MDETLFATKPRTKKNVSARSNGTSGLEAASSLSGFYSGVSFLLLTLGFQLVIDSSSKGQHNRLVLVRCFAAHAWQSSGQLSMQLHCKHVCTRTMQVLFSSLPVPLVANASLQGNFFPLKKTSFFNFFFFSNLHHHVLFYYKTTLPAFCTPSRPSSFPTAAPTSYVHAVFMTTFTVCFPFL